jgi:hypothetical protein
MNLNVAVTEGTLPTSDASLGGAPPQQSSPLKVSAENAETLSETLRLVCIQVRDFLPEQNRFATVHQLVERFLGAEGDKATIYLLLEGAIQCLPHLLTTEANRRFQKSIEYGSKLEEYAQRHLLAKPDHGFTELQRQLAQFADSRAEFAQNLAVVSKGEELLKSREYSFAAAALCRSGSSIASLIPRIERSLEYAKREEAASLERRMTTPFPREVVTEYRSYLAGKTATLEQEWGFLLSQFCEHLRLLEARGSPTPAQIEAAMEERLQLPNNLYPRKFLAVFHPERFVDLPHLDGIATFVFSRLTSR